MRRAPLLLTLIALAAGCGGAEEAAAPQPPPAAAGDLFDYDRAAPLEPTSRVIANKGGVRTSDVTYASPGDGRVTAYLLEPSTGDANGPPVIYLHGGGGNRADLLPVAVGWVRRGGRALLIDAAPTRSAATARDRLRAEREAEAKTVIRVRRAVDYLAADRVGLVGWSAGARTGAVVAGVEPRIDAFALMSGGAAPLDEYAAQAPASLRDDVRDVLGDVDPLRWVQRARPNTIFFQNGTKDEVIPRAALEALAAAASKSQRIRWYDAGHALHARAFGEQYDWLDERLR